LNVKWGKTWAEKSAIEKVKVKSTLDLFEEKKECQCEWNLGKKGIV
jgi:hypothetical protein